MYPLTRLLQPLFALPLVLAVPLPAAGDHEVFLEVLSPRQDESTVPTQPAGGWSLILRLRTDPDNDPAIGVASASAGPFPIEGQTGYLVYGESGTCFAPESEDDPPAPLPDCLELLGATYVEFTPDVDSPDVADRSGNGLVRKRQGSSSPFDCRPPVLKFDVGPAPIGPPTGAFAFSDGYGYGADDDLPGLVITSNVGVGVALDREYVRRSPAQALNLAGFISSLTYELNDVDHRTNLLVSMVVPREIFAPLVLADGCVGKPRTCDGEKVLYRIDGGPLLSELPAHINRVATLRAFVVNGTAPSVLEDLDSDSDVDARDAEMAGLRLLSEEVVITFEQIACSEHCVDELLVDLDHNGNAAIPVLLSRAKSGPSIKKPPR